MNQRNWKSTVGVGPELGGATPLDPGQPFRIAILGDFSGRASRDLLETGDALAERKAVQVDRDNFDEVMQRFGVRLEGLLVSEDDSPVSLSFREMDDFGPDQLYEAVDLFSSLRALRRRLLNPDTFESAADEVLGWRRAESRYVGGQAGQTSAEPLAPAPHQIDDLLEEVLGHSQVEADAQSASHVNWQQLIGSLVGEVDRLPDRDRQKALVGYVDDAAQATMLALLHHPGFQELEAAWRSLYLLVRRLETDAKLKIAILDISKQELAKDLAVDDVTSSGLFRLLVGGTRDTPGAAPWGAIVGHYEFGALESDLATLHQMARIAAASGAPFLSAAKRSIVGCPPGSARSKPAEWQPPESASWQALRNLPEASYLCLAWPRFLVRLPYGKRWRPIEKFDFEEVSANARFARLLWGNPAMLGGLLLAQSFTKSGWDMKLGEVTEVQELPIWVYEDEDGDEQVHPCGELLLTEEGVISAAAAGVAPVMSFQDQDKVRIAGFESVHGGSLAGRWG